MYLAEWKGVPLSAILGRCRGEWITAMPVRPSTWSSRKPQTVFAYEMNGRELPIEHGRPLRLRVGSQLGCKMIKCIRGIEFVEDFRHMGWGQGGWRDDALHYYPSDAGI